MINIALEKSTNCWNCDIYYTSVLDLYKILTHEHIFIGLSRIVLRSFGHPLINLKVRGNSGFGISFRVKI